jgi:hypothetical protein
MSTRAVIRPIRPRYAVKFPSTSPQHRGPERSRDLHGRSTLIDAYTVRRRRRPRAGDRSGVRDRRHRPGSIHLSQLVRI